MPPTALPSILFGLIAALLGAGGAAMAPQALGGAPPILLIAGLIFLVGLAFAGFLWWLAARSFALLGQPGTTPEQIAALRDLPMALPEGTVRAILALIVGVVGLPLLLFAAALNLSDAIAGYVNGIIAGVFGYYFGARGGSPDAQASRRVAEALGQEQRAHEALRQTTATAIEAATDAATRPAREADAMAQLERHLAVASDLVENFGAALPPGLLPAEAPAMLRRAREALSAARGNPPDISRIADATAALTGAGGPFATLLRLAGPLLPAMAGGPLAGVALLLGLGWTLSSAAWRRWQAQVLDAPHDPALFDPGAITPQEALARLTPIFTQALAPLRDSPGFAADLLDMALRDDGAARIWARWGAGHFDGPAAVDAGLAEYRRALLAGEAAQDVSAEAVQRVAAGLSGAAAPLRPDGATAPALPAPQAGTAEQRAALQALTLLLGRMRETRQDPLQILREVTP
jgi:hypothetical protein